MEALDLSLDPVFDPVQWAREEGVEGKWWVNAAWDLLQEYYIDVVSLMRRHGVDRVGPLVSGLLFSSAPNRNRRHNQPDKRADLIRDLRYLHYYHSGRFWQAFAGGEAGQDEEEPLCTSIERLLTLPNYRDVLLNVVLGACACYQVRIGRQGYGSCLTLFYCLSTTTTTNSTIERKIHSRSSSGLDEEPLSYACPN